MRVVIKTDRTALGLVNFSLKFPSRVPRDIVGQGVGYRSVFDCSMFHSDRSLRAFLTHRNTGYSETTGTRLIRGLPGNNNA